MNINLSFCKAYVYITSMICNTHVVVLDFLCETTNKLLYTHTYAYEVEVLRCKGRSMEKKNLILRFFHFLKIVFVFKSLWCYNILCFRHKTPHPAVLIFFNHCQYREYDTSTLRNHTTNHILKSVSFIVRFS